MRNLTKALFTLSAAIILTSCDFSNDQEHSNDKQWYKFKDTNKRISPTRAVFVEKVFYKSKDGDTARIDEYVNDEHIETKTLVNGELDGIHYDYRPYNKDYYVSKTPYKNGKKDGLEEMFYHNSRIAERTYYKNNTRNGTSTYYYKYGNYGQGGGIREQYSYVNGKLHGESRSYRENDGTLEKVVNYKNGQLHGDMFEYDVDGETVLKTTTYIEGNAEGFSVKSSCDGTCTVEETRKNGQLVGKQIFRYESGALMSKSFYIDGHLQGKVQEYYEHGKIKETSYYHKGLLHGKTVFYNEDGMVEDIQYHLSGNEVDAQEYKDAKRFDKSLSNNVSLEETLGDITDLRKTQNQKPVKGLILVS